MFCFVLFLKVFKTNLGKILLPCYRLPHYLSLLYIILRDETKHLTTPPVTLWCLTPFGNINANALLPLFVVHTDWWDLSLNPAKERFWLKQLNRFQGGWRANKFTPFCLCMFLTDYQTPLNRVIVWCYWNKLHIKCDFFKC